MLERNSRAESQPSPGAVLKSGVAPLSVIIVNYYSEAVLEACLHSLGEAGGMIEAIVVDNGSEDRWRRSVQDKHSWVRWIGAGGNVGFGRACNLGAMAAQGASLLFLNPDARLASGAAEAILGRLEQSDGGRIILGCQVRSPDGTRQLSCRRFPTWRTAVANRYSFLTRLWPSNPWSSAYLMHCVPGNDEQTVDWVSGAAMAMRKTTFESLGGFSEDYFMYMEDVDLCKRAWEMGFPVKYYPDAAVLHSIGGSSCRVPVRALGYRHRSIWTYYKKHLRVRAADPLVAAFLAVRWGAISMGLATRMLLQNWWRDGDSPTGRTS